VLQSCLLFYIQVKRKYLITKEKVVNRNQKRILLVSMVIFIVMSLYPPWQFVSHGVTHPAGYGLLFSPPQPQLHDAPGLLGGTSQYTSWGDYPSNVEARVNMTTLGIEWITLAVAVSVLMVLAKSPKN
jgi:hypothetical protein